MKTISDCSQLKPDYDLVVIGAGPAGMAAAATADQVGLKTLLLDENPAPGGQIYRSITTTKLRRALLGADYWRGASLVENLERCGASYAPCATGWYAGPAEESAELQAGVSLRGRATMISARQLILATGALERPFPIPGWTLPGVMSAGAAQIALKSASLVPKGRTIVAGCGPLLYLLTAQLRAAGADIAMLLDTTPAGNWRSALRNVPDFLRSSYVLKGLRLLRDARNGLQYVKGVSELRAEGNGRLESVTFQSATGGALTRVKAETLLLHQGVTPNINLSSAAGCQHDWDETQLAFVPRLDEWLCSTVRNVAIAGDGAGIVGAEGAAIRGRLAAVGAALRLGLDPAECDRLAAPIRAALAQANRGRRFLDTLYRPARNFRVPPSADTVVCRCEEVTAGRIRDAIALGTPGPNQLKTFLRCGMGPCQGRMCGLTVTEMIAEARGVTPAQVGYYRLRPPVKPITVAEFATLPQTQSALRAVDR